MALGWKWLIRSRSRIIVWRCGPLFPGRTTGLVWLSWIFGGLFVLMYALAKLRQKLTRRDRLAAVPRPAGG
jgi:hypothetical protein